MAKQLMPAAELEPRERDLHLTEEQFLRLSLFAQMKKKPSIDKFPGTLVLRRFRKGEVICQQGEAGWTAFYILTTEDELVLRQILLEMAAKERERLAWQTEIELLRQRLEGLGGKDRQCDERRVATVYLAVANPTEKKASVLDRIQKATRHLPPQSIERQTLYIPIDGPSDVDYKSLRAKLYEGDLFGEMSCMYRTPRSATVVAKRDCYMLEMLRNILDQLQRDPAYKSQSDEVYKQRVFQLHLRKLSIFRELTEEQYQTIAKEAELVSFEPGQLICDEHDHSDCMYLVRTGLVKVVKNISSLLAVKHVRDWMDLCRRLLAGEKEPATPAGKVWQLLPNTVRALVRTSAVQVKPERAVRQKIVHGLNQVIKDRQLVEAKEFQEVAAGPEFRELLVGLPEKRKDWSETQARRVNRALLEAVFTALAPDPLRSVGPESILSYCSRGDLIGEIGVMLRQPRSATCVAYGHPNDYGQVELVRIPEQAFWRLIEASPAVRQKVEKEIIDRRLQTAERLSTPVWDDTRQVQLSGRFEELGLIQGQKLMLIDLDRCTRCDECVQACVHTHADGRSRLFLDGPRFGKYLVPTTCRSCLDPVCMIGCPVGSIHRGDNRQIIIEDWCIGCGLCASSCPYGAIQMHDIGLLGEHARDWRYLPLALVKGDKWKQPGFADDDWLVADGPIGYDREFEDSLAQCKKGSQPVPGGEIKLGFRKEFHAPPRVFRGTPQFRVEITTCAAVFTVWINGHELKTADKPKRGKLEYAIPPKGKPGEEGKKSGGPLPLRSGRNVVAVQLAAKPNRNDILLALRVDEVRKPNIPGEVGEEITEKLVTEHAVVCDLCSALPGQTPACVHACPHDAAMRVNARFEFPVA